MSNTANLPSPRRPDAARASRRRLRWWHLAWVALGVLLWSAVGCQGGGQTSGESHFGKTKAFLRICEDGACGSGDDCVCAVCTVPCEGVQQCRQRISGDAEDADLPDSIVCRAPMCGDHVSDEATPDAGSVCDVECSEDADCAFLDADHEGQPHFCNGGYCRTLEEPDGAVDISAEPPVVCPAGMQLVPGSELPGGVGLCLATTEVTVEEYTACVDAGLCVQPAAGNYLTAGREQHPVQFVSELDAESYCAFAGARLPTWAEWSVAASGGAAQSLYPWGDDVPTADDEPARVCALGATTTCAVESFSAGNGSWGHTDLAGNVAEWVVLEAGHCLAGGHFESPAEELTAETCSLTLAVDEHAGFRCARDL